MKVTVNVIRWTVVVLVSPVTWAYEARNHALKVFNYFDLFDGSIETFNILHSLSLSACVCQAHMETDVNRNAIDAKMAPSVTTSLVSFHVQEMLRAHNKKRNS